MKSAGVYAKSILGVLCVLDVNFKALFLGRLTGRRQCLAGIEYTGGIELALDGVHQCQAGGVEFSGHPVALHQADAVLTGNGAVHLQHGGEHVFQAGVGALFLVGIVWIIRAG